MVESRELELPASPALCRLCGVLAACPLLFSNSCSCTINLLHLQRYWLHCCSHGVAQEGKDVFFVFQDNELDRCGLNQPLLPPQLLLACFLLPPG
eukprot:2704398-Amphidinium_carterae.1